MIANSDQISVGCYLATRLRQLQASHVFGLPGDYNLNLLDEMTQVDGVTWVGSANELNAAYAADGFARLGRRIGAVVTTYGVGELSALNGIAGSFAENVPVLHIAGMPSLESMRRGLPLHHTLLDGDYEHFLRMFREVTVADAVLEPAKAGAQIDRVLTAMITASKPGYLGIPLDIARHPIAAAPLLDHLEPEPSSQGAVDAFERALTDRLASTESIAVLAGPQVHRRALERTVAALAEIPGVRIASQIGSKAILDEEHPASLGTYFGAVTKSPERAAAIDDADTLVLIGTVFSDFTTGFFSHRYDPSNAVELALDHARIGHAIYPKVFLADALNILQRVAAATRPASVATIAHAGESVLDSPSNGSDLELTHATFWPQIQDWIEPDSTIAAEAGTAFYGALDLTLPARSDLLGQPVWSSIGYTLPATFGGMLARPDRRPILFIGDGSAQLTIQELGHLYAYAPGAVVFLLDNDGYTVERQIQSPEAHYQDIVRWNWELLPAALGAPDVTVACARTVDELRSALQQARDRQRSSFIRVVLPKEDAPRLLKELAKGIVSANSSAG